MDDFEEFRARSYSGGFIQPLHRSKPLGRRRISLNAELATRVSSSRSAHPESATPISQCTGLSLLLSKTFGSKQLRRSSGYDDTYRRNGEAEAGKDAKGIGSSSLDETEMRPRVSSAPTQTCGQRSRRMTDAVTRDSPSPPRFQKVRSFSLTQKGIICQGYTYVRSSPEVQAPADGSISGFQPVVSGGRNYSSKDIHFSGSQQEVTPEVLEKSKTHHGKNWNRHFRLQLMGGSGAGKSSILAHFVQPESNLHSNASDYSPDGSPVDGCESSVVYTALDGQLYELDITEMTIRTPVQNEFLVNELTDIDGCLVVFSVEDRRSFELAIDCLYEIRTRLRIAATVVTLAANKSDLVRTRVISEQEGRSAAKTYGNRYIEVSATIGLNIDQLLIGTLKQMCLLKRSGSGSTSSAASAAVHQVYDDAEPRKGSVLASLGLRLPCFDPSSCVCLLCARRSAIVKLLRQ